MAFSSWKPEHLRAGRGLRDYLVPSHFTDEETDTPRVMVTCSKSVEPGLLRQDFPSCAPNTLRSVALPQCVSEKLKREQGEMGERQSSREFECECGGLGQESWQRYVACWEVCKPLFHVYQSRH